MGLLDLFTGAASERAARNNRNTIATGLNQATTALGDNYANANGVLTGSALPALGAGYAQARNDVAGQYNTTQGYLGQLGANYAPMVAGGQNAFNRYLNASGANGEAGSAQAAQDFTAAPGTQYAMNQALDAVQRTAAARGGLAGGNTTAGILQTATGLADQNYNNYLQNLKDASGFYTTGLAGQAQGLGAQATASQNQGTALGALGTGLGTAQAGVYGQQASNLTNLGNAAAGVIGNATNAYTANNNNLAASENAAGANILGGILGTANLLTGQAGGAAGRAAGGGGSSGGLGSFLSGLFK